MSRYLGGALAVLVLTADLCGAPERPRLTVTLDMGSVKLVVETCHLTRLTSAPRAQ
jgi:hypothetical protein